MRFTISSAPAVPSFTPVAVSIVAENATDLMLLTNLFGGVPAEATSPAVDDLATQLRSQCDAAGIAKASRKAATGFNWGKKLREYAAQLADVE